MNREAAWYATKVVGALAVLGALFWGVTAALDAWLGEEGGTVATLALLLLGMWALMYWGRRPKVNGEGAK